MTASLELQEALERAKNGTSQTNYDAIKSGFAAMGLDAIPRENVFTLAAWQAQGRKVKRSELGRGVRIVSKITVEKKETDPDTGEELTRKCGKRRRPLVYHVSQTLPMDENDTSAPAPGGEDEPERFDVLTVRENAKRTGIRIFFPAKPDDLTREGLRSGGWKWHGSKGYWYNRATDDTRELAQALLDAFGGVWLEPEEDEPEPDPNKPKPGGAASGHDSTQADALAQADKLDNLAARLRKKAESKIHSPISSQRHARRRERIAASMAEDGFRMQEAADVLSLNADALRTGKDSMPLIAGINTIKAAVDMVGSLRWRSPEKLDEIRAAAYSLHASKSPELIAKMEKQRQETEIRKLESGLVGAKIPGFFPTPRPVIARMFELLGPIEHELTWLEPSAGKGDIADAIRERAPGATLDIIEIHHMLEEILKKKGYAAQREDFLHWHKRDIDRILMNPPFERGQDADHIRHAYDILADGGKLVAVAGAGIFSRQDAKATAFRAWLNTVDAYVEDLPEGSFKDGFVSTGVSAKLVRIIKNS